ncbi:ribosome maturation factor RimP [Miniimonas sp. S16]|uniref:ribosome maturation factor RimP n=1 Tax=Miniimonas sp. S16 TaxID=2171623 RepID=UPI000D528F8C|nr:ribosome maturation factor RimP [Miniimonas sp. S16]
MASDTLDRRIGAVVEPVVRLHDLALEAVEVRSVGKRRLVRVVLDLADGPGSLGSDLLGEASRAISAALDEHDVIPGAYTLEVTTPGVERPLTTPRHYRRAEGRLVTARRTAAAIADGAPRSVTGRVVGADETGVTLRVDGSDAVVPYSTIENAVVELELRRLEED